MSKQANHTNNYTAAINKQNRDYVKRIKSDQKIFEKFVQTIPTFPGWVGEWKNDVTEIYGERIDTPSYVLTWAANHMKMEFYPGGDGTTSFEVEGKGWLNFDRTGVESSFYWKAWDHKGAETPDMREVINEQCKRVADRREYYKSAINIPQIGFTTSPAGKLALIEDLKRNGRRNFMPSGFGTGYTISTSTKRLWNASRATPELETFIGISPLFVSTFDAD